MAARKITAVLKGADRLGNSLSGNPTWLVHTLEGSFKTARDAAVGYDVANLTHPRLGSVGQRVTLHVNGRGTIDYITEEGGE